jgi:hypothetical protein
VWIGIVDPDDDELLVLQGNMTSTRWRSRTR